MRPQTARDLQTVLRSEHVANRDRHPSQLSSAFPDSDSGPAVGPRPPAGRSSIIVRAFSLSGHSQP